MKPALTFFVSHVQVDLFCTDAATVKGLSAVWGNADHPVVPTSERKVIRTVDGCVWCDDRLMAEYRDPSAQLPTTELVINRLLMEWHRHLTAFHAALISQGDRAFMLIGPSGSGKSSLALQAVDSGWTFHSDELAVTDGSLVWGVRRAVQFDATEQHQPLPPHMSGADRDSYQWQDAQLGTLAQPIVSVPGRALPCLLALTSPVFLKRSKTDLLTAIDSASALQQLYESSFGPPKHDLGVVAGQAWTLQWHEPVKAIQCLQTCLDEVSRSASARSQ